jgi:hypothetical protein
MVAQFMISQQALNERLQDSTDQINARLQALLTVTNDAAAATTGGANTPLPTGASTPLPSLNLPLTDIRGRPKHTTPHPERFTGEDESLYPIFRGLLEAKLRTDAQAIGGDYEQVWYAFGRLADTASKRIFPWVQHMQNGPEFTVDCLFKQMDLSFLDQQKQAKAVTRINMIKQRNRPFREFLQEFDQTLMEANGWSWQEEVKKGLLKAALAGEVKRELVGRDEPVTYPAYVAQIRKITDDLGEWKDEQKFKGRFQKQQFTAPQQSSTDEQMDWEPTRTAPVAAAKTSQPRNQGKPRAKWVSPQEITRRQDANECLRCGSSEHYIGQCHMGPARRPNPTSAPEKKQKVRTAAAKTKKKNTPAPAVVEEVESEADSDSVYGSENE